MSGSTTQFTVPAAADAIAAAIGDREFIIQGDRRYTYAQIVERSKRLGAYLHTRGLGCHTERSELQGHEVGQDLLGIYAYNGPEYVESMLGSWRARVAPFNVNYRYVKNELHYLLADSGATALIYHAAFAPRVADVLPDLPRLRVLIQIADDSGNDLVHGAIDYESIVASGPVQLPPVEPSPDDLYVLYTGGTTGMPKGVLWRQHDIFMTSFGGRSLYTGETANTYDEIVKRCLEMPAGTKLMILPPLMHGAAQWAAMTAMTTGQSVVFSTATSTFDADEVVRTIEREKVLSVTVVGDAMARPLAAAIERGTADISSLAVVANGGALLTPTAKQRLIDAKPGLMVADGVGSSETGAQMTHMSAPGAVATGKFNAGPDTSVAAEDLSTILDAGSRRHRLARAAGLCAVGLQGRCGQDGGDVPGHRWCAVLGAGRSRTPSRRRRHRIARPGLGIRSTPAARRSSSRRSRRRSHRTRPWPMWSSRAGRASGGGRRSSRSSHSSTAPASTPRNSSTTPQARSPGTSCPRRWCSGRSSNAARQARPTTGGPASRRSAATLEPTARAAARHASAPPLAPTRIDPLNGGAARPVMVNGRSVPTTVR